MDKKIYWRHDGCTTEDSFQVNPDLREHLGVNGTYSFMISVINHESCTIRDIWVTLRTAAINGNLEVVKAIMEYTGEFMWDIEDHNSVLTFSLLCQDDSKRANILGYLLSLPNIRDILTKEDIAKYEGMLGG